MNYSKLSLEELEELFLQQREHHYALTEAVSLPAVEWQKEWA